MSTAALFWLCPALSIWVARKVRATKSKELVNQSHAQKLAGVEIWAELKEVAVGSSELL